MSISDRIKLIVKANLNDMISKAENPAKAMELMLEEMRQNIRSVKSLILEATAELKRAERTSDENIQQANEWEGKAEFALKKGREDLARQALSRKKTLLERGESYREQIAVQRANIESLKESLKALEAKMDELRTSHIKIAAKQEYAKRRPTHVRISPPEPVVPVIDTAAVDAYDRMVSKVEEMETLAEAIAEMAQEDQLEQEFRQLEAQDELDRDLAALKAKVTGEET